RLPKGVPIRLREEPDDLLARPGPPETIAEVLTAEQPRDDLRRVEELRGSVRRGGPEGEGGGRPSAPGVELNPPAGHGDGAERATHRRVTRLRERDPDWSVPGRPEPLTAQDRLHDVLAIGLADAPRGVQDIHHLAGGLLFGAGSQVGDDRFGYDEVGEL